jgi:hypothetical protein
MQLRKGALVEAERAAGALPGDVHDPVHNVRMGIRYLAKMVEKFGDVDLGLMAYNAGPGRLLSYRAAEEVPDSVLSYVRKVRREERKLQGEQSKARRSERFVPALCVSSHRPPRPGPGIALEMSAAARPPAVRGPLEWPTSPGLVAVRRRALSPAATAKARETLEKKDGFAKLPKEEQDKAIAAETKANLLTAWRETVEKTPALTELGELQRQAQWRLDFVAAENSMGFHAPQEMARILAESIDLSRQAEIKAAALQKGPLAMNEPSPAPAGGKVAK